MPERQWPQTWGERQSFSALLVGPLSLNRCTQLQSDTDMTEMSLTGCSASVAGFPRFFSPITLQLTCQLNYAIMSPLLFFFLCLFKIHSASHSSLILLCFLQPPLLACRLILQFILWFLLQLHKVAVGRASDLLKVHGEQLPLRALKAAGAEGNLEAVAEYSRKLTEQKEQLVEVGWGRRKGSREAGRGLVVVPPSRGVHLVNNTPVV